MNTQKLKKYLLNKKMWGWIGVSVAMLIMIFCVTNPIRTKSSNDYIKKGDQFLAEKKYLNAELTYKKALSLKSSNQLAKDRIELTNKASIDIVNMEKFYSENGFSKQSEDLKKAEGFPENEVKAVEEAKELIQNGEYQLAIMVAGTATEMDSEYRDAWLYVGIANLKTAQNVEVRVEYKEKYLAKAKEAFTKAVALDPEYKIAQDYAKEAENIKL